LRDRLMLPVATVSSTTSTLWCRKLCGLVGLYGPAGSSRC
jgi:hypothetical protein